MSRGRTAPQIAADTARHSGSAALLELLFTSGPLRLCLGRWNVTFEGNVYTATAGLLQISRHEESADGAEGLDFTMSGLAAGVFDLMINEPYRGRLVRLMELRFNEADVDVGLPSVEYIGRMVAMSSADSAKDGTHTVRVQTEQFDAEGRRARPLRFSDAEQRRRFPSDLGAEYVTALTEVVMARKPKT